MDWRRWMRTCKLENCVNMSLTEFESQFSAVRFSCSSTKLQLQLGISPRRTPPHTHTHTHTPTHPHTHTHTLPAETALSVCRPCLSSCTSLISATKRAWLRGWRCTVCVCNT